MSEEQNRILKLARMISEEGESAEQGEADHQRPHVQGASRDNPDPLRRLSLKR